MKISKITLKGNAGQGIKLVSKILTKILMNKGYNIALTTDYSPFVRAGDSNAFIVFSKNKITTPLIDKPDIKYDLRDKTLQQELLSKYDNRKVMNMSLLGKILNKLNFQLTEKDIKIYLGKKFSSENLSAISANFE